MRIHIHLRRLLRSRVFLVTAVLVLGLGLGVNLTLFNTVYALLWRPLGFPQSDRLVTLYGRSAGGDLNHWITGQDAWTLRQQAGVIAEAGLAKSGGQVTLLNGADSFDMAAASVDSGYFKALGVRPVAGRFFGEEEDLGANPEQRAVLTESAWRAHFGSDPSVVNGVFPRQDGANRRPLRIVGIVPGSATLPFAPEAEILLPLPSAGDTVRLNYGDALYRSVARLQPAVRLPQASAAIDAAFQAGERGSSFGVWGRRWVEPLRAALAPVDRPTMLQLYGSACLLLVLTCANLASLFVVRAMTRTHETSVHLALGASRWRLLRANFQEALLVCAAGTALAFLVESWARPLIPLGIPELKRIGPELLSTGPVLLVFGFLMCLGVSLVVSITSGLWIQKVGLAEALSQGVRSGLSGAGRFRAALAAAQVAIVLTLLTLAGLVGRSFLSAMRADPGLDPQGVITFRASLPGSQRNSLPAIADLQRQIASVPGVKSVAFAAELPVGSPAFSTVTAAHGGDLVPGDPMIQYRLAGLSYFETLGARMAGGRTFTAEEIEQGRPAVVLNQAATRLLFPSEEPVGRTVHSGFGGRISVVVGVVKDIRTEALDKPPVPMVYMAYLPVAGLRFMVRTDSAFSAFIPMLKSRVLAWNSAAVLQQFKPLRDIVDETVRDRIIRSVLVGGFALLGLIVSSVGLYGTLAAHVHQRRREIGVRIAMGATVRVVVAGILAEGMRIVAFGSLAGVAGSAVAARLIERQLYGVSPLDPIAFALALILLSSTALAACLIPAFKAAHLDPIQTLNVQ